MPALKPSFTLDAGALHTTSADAAGMPSRLVVERGMDAACDALRITLADRSGVAIDDDVTLALGHDEDEEPVFKGTVAAVRPGVEGVEVWALGGLRGLAALHVAALFEDQSAGAIARDLAGQADVPTGTVDNGPNLPRYVADGRRSAYAHLQALADRLGFELYADVDGKLMFHAPGAAAGERYAYGEHLLDVGARLRPEAGGVTVSGESPMSTEGDTAVAWLTTSPADYRGEAGGGERLVIDAVARTTDLANQFARGLVAVGARTEHNVRATVLGRPGLDLGSRVEVAGHADEQAGGGGYVRALRHRFDSAGGFLTDVRVAVLA